MPGRLYNDNVNDNARVQLCLFAGDKNDLSPSCIAQRNSNANNKLFGNSESSSTFFWNPRGNFIFGDDTREFFRINGDGVYVKKKYQNFEGLTTIGSTGISFFRTDTSGKFDAQYTATSMSLLGPDGNVILKPAQLIFEGGLPGSLEARYRNDGICFRKGDSKKEFLCGPNSDGIWVCKAGCLGTI